MKVSAERRGYSGAVVRASISENGLVITAGLLEAILSRGNMNAAYKRVKSNKGAGGVDRMSVDELFGWLVEHGAEMLEQIRDGRYKPSPVRRVEIPKETRGEFRKLGVPTVVDRVVQQAIAQVLTWIYEKKFSEASYGFRPKRSAHDALKRCKTNVDEGYVYVVDMDLEKFFDTVCHSKLMQVISRTIRDGRVLSLIHKYLNAGAMVKGLFERTEVGTPQGGPLSPLLSNIMLNELDRELERRGLRFVRYADDCMIFCRSRKAAERALAHILPFIEGKLFLKVNRQKTQIAHISRVKYLGYGFYIKKGRCRYRIHPKSVQKLKSKLRVITSRSNGWGVEYRQMRLRQFVRGWVNYFKLADMKKLLETADEWLRSRIRAIYWKQWKRIRTRFENLQRLGIRKERAWEWANSRKSYTRTAHSPILTKSLTNERLAAQGWTTLSGEYRRCCAA